MFLPSRKVIFIVLCCTLVLVSVFLFGFFVRKPKDVGATKTKSTTKERSVAETSNKIVAEMDSRNIEANLRYFSGGPHQAASKRNNELGDEIHRRFLSYGFQSRKERYKVLLSYPRKDKQNKVVILTDTGIANFTSQKIEDKLASDEDPQKSLQPFLAYAPAGEVKGDLIYVNYGRESDFKLLKDKFNISCVNQIVIARYGKIGRGSKVKNAEAQGAGAIVIYHDPEDYAPKGAGPVYPKGWWLPEDGVQRGTIQLGDGDPLTPYYASLDDSFRMPLTSDEVRLPKIPAHPISSRDAIELLRHMDGQEVPEEWKGGLDITYKIGPGFSGQRKAWKTKVEVHNERKLMNITNIIGTIRGSVEPDRYVLVGNHRDAWVNGAADPSSGTSVMMEMARAFGEIVKQGWKPRRSIVFCSWDGEESGLIGSVEWTEQHSKILQDRAVAYINLDTVVYGNYSLRASGSPLLHNILYKATKETEDSFKKGVTAFDTYKKAYPSKTKPEMPLIGQLGSGSDYFAFYHRMGIPSLDLSYSMRQLNMKYNTSFYPVYHTMHDTFTWMKNSVDPAFRCHLTVARVASLCLVKIADSSLIPWNVDDYAFDMNNGINKLEDLFKKANASSFQTNTNNLKKALEVFKETAKKFTNSIKTEDLLKPYRLRELNDRLMQLEKGFIVPGGLPKRRDYSHMIYSPPRGARSLFPTIVDAVNSPSANKDKWDNVKKQLSITAAAIRGVAETLTGGLYN